VESQQHLIRLQKMEKILELRERRAEAACCEARLLLDEIEERRAGYDKKLQSLRASLQSINEFKSNLEDQSFVQSVQDAQSYRRLLVYDMEEAEYYHSKAVEDAKAQQAACEELQKTWAKATHKRSRFKDLELEEDMRLVMQDEQLLDDEVTELMAANR